MPIIDFYFLFIEADNRDNQDGRDHGDSGDDGDSGDKRDTGDTGRLVATSSSDPQGDLRQKSLLVNCLLLLEYLE